MSEVKGSDRVSIETDVHQFYQDMAERSGRDSDPETSPFLLMKDVFMWAVSLGVKAGRRRPLAGAKTQIFRWDQFSQDRDVPTLKIIAIAETGDIDVLQQEDQILRIAEEYANAGIRELEHELVDQPGKPLWNLVSQIRRIPTN